MLCCVSKIQCVVSCIMAEAGKQLWNMSMCHVVYQRANVSCRGEVGGWGRVPFSRNLMKPTPRRKWYLTTGRRFH